MICPTRSPTLRSTMVSFCLPCFCWLNPPKSHPITFSHYIYSIIQMCVCVSMAACVAEGRLAPWAAPVCSFVVPKMGPKTGPKNGAAILPEEGKASKMAAPFLGPGCCIHSQPPSACNEQRRLRNLSFVFLALGLTKPHPSFTVYIYMLYYITIYVDITFFQENNPGFWLWLTWFHVPAGFF